MQVGNLVNGLEVVHVVRVTSLNLMAFTRDVNKYIQDGYHIDVASTREVGLQKRVDMYKLESNVGEGKIENIEPESKEKDVDIVLGEQQVVVESSTEEKESQVSSESPTPTTKKTTSTRKKTT